MLWLLKQIDVIRSVSHIRTSPARNSFFDMNSRFSFLHNRDFFC